LSYSEALEFLAAWDGPTSPPPRDRSEANLRRALRLWDRASPIGGTLAQRYLSETREIDFASIPGEALRFLPNCPFGPDARYSSLLALFRDVETDAFAGIHRIALTSDGEKVDRRMLGSCPSPRAIKLWPAAGAGLVIGEGVETVLAAAIHQKHRGTTTVSITAVNDAPTLSGVGATAAFTENGAAVTLAGTASVPDPDNPNLASATVAITGGTFASDGDALAANVSGTSITASYDAATETLTLTGSDTLAHYQLVLDSLTFNATSLNPTTYGSNSTRIVT
jgi:hypothetical protein